MLLPLLLPALTRADPLFVDAPAWAPAAQGCVDTTAGCYSNQTTLVDVDGDGRLDALFANGGGYYVPGDAEPIGAWRNTGTAFVLADWFGAHTGRHRQLAVGDLDGDGDLDVVAPDAWAMQPDAVFLNDGAGGFVEVGATWLGTSSRAGAARLGDVDDDGDLDLFVSDWGDAPPNSVGVGHLYRNDGDRFVPVEGIPADLSDIGTGPIDSDFVDIDGDWDLDLLLASRQGDSLLLRNDGAGVYTNADVELPVQKGPYVYGPDACDLDGDGDLDLWLDNGANRDLDEQLLLNDGTGSFDDATVQVKGNLGADDNEVQCADVDGDGDFDAIVASLSDEERVLINDGAATFDLLEGAFTPMGDATLGLDLGDLDGDGRFDAVTGQGEGGSFLNRVYLGVGVAVDARGPVFRASRRGDGWVDVAISDAFTTDVGPRVTVSAEDGAVGVWRGGDLFRVPVDGDGAVRVCASDGVNEGCVDIAGLGLDDTGTDGKVDDGCGCAGARGGGGGLLVGLGLIGVVGRRRDGAVCGHVGAA